MDRETLGSLERALAASPGNVELVGLFLRGCDALDDVERAAAALEACEVEALPGPLRVLGASLLRRADRPEQALALTADAPDTPPAELLERARCLLALERHEEGRACYERAVEASPSLEDLTLAAELRARVRSVQGGGRPGLRLVGGDEGTEDGALRALLQPEQEVVRFADVGGLEDVKDQIRKRIILPFQKPSLFQRFRKRVGGGILLYGPPGCGKTLLARATAGECSARFFSVAISDVLDLYVGESERKLHALFETARQSVPSVLFFDEVEALGARRQYQRDGTTAKLVSQFLAEMDGFAQQAQGVLVLAATNVPWSVDAAFRRPGRFDRTVFVPPPDRPARESILSIHLRGRPVAADVDVADIARRTSGYSGADLLGVVEAAADAAIAESLASGTEQEIAARHVRAALGEVKSTTLEWLTTARNHARYANEGGQYDDVLRFLERFGKA